MEVPPTQNNTAPVSLQTSSARLKLTAWLKKKKTKDNESISSKCNINICATNTCGIEIAKCLGAPGGKPFHLFTIFKCHKLETK